MLRVPIMIILGIETSTEVCSVGLARPGQKPKEERVAEERIHSEKLLTMVQRLLTRENISMRELNAVAVSIGPGSFTGLRIGLSTAKGLCYALNLPLVTVPTFDAIAQAVADIRPRAGNILVALDAKKGDFYSGRYTRVGGSAVPMGSTKLKSEAEMKKEIAESPPELLVTGRVLHDHLRFEGERADIHDFCRGDSVAQIGLSRASAGLFADVESCEPMYLKDFVVIGKTSAV